MIYSKDIQISYLGSPINFTLPIESFIYKDEDRYTPVIATNFLLQVRISQDLYNSNSVLRLFVNDRDGNYTEFFFSKCKLSDGYYYANTTVLIGGIDKLVNFTIYNNDDLLADSNWNNVNPSFSDVIKNITFTNKTNDYNCVFKEDLSTLKLTSYSTTIDKAEITYNRDDLTYDISIKTNFDDVCTVSVRDFDTDEIIHEEETNFYIEQVIQIDKDLMIGTTCYVKLIYQNNIIAKSDIYLYYTTFKKINNFNQTIECGFIPDGIKVLDNQTDFQNQKYNNTLLYSMPYVTRVLTIGSSIGIPNFLYIRLSYIFACSTFFIGNILYKRSFDSDLELIEGTYKGLGFYKITLETENNYSQIEESTGDIFDYTYNDSFN